MSELAYSITSKPTRRFRTLNAVTATIGVVLIFVAWSWNLELWSLAFGVPFFLLAIPLKLGSPLDRGMRIASTYIAEKRTGGALHSRQAVSDKTPATNFLDDVQTDSITVTVNGKPTSLGVTITPETVTVYCRVVGHPAWASGDARTKMGLDSRITKAIVAAAEETNQSRMQIVFRRGIYPKDPHPQAVYKRRRLDEGMLRSAIEHDGSVNAAVATNALTGSAKAEASGADLSAHIAIIMPTQRHPITRQLTDLHDMEAFRKSNLFRTLQTLERELRATGVEGVQLLSRMDVVMLLQGYRVNDAEIMYAEARYDVERAIVDKTDPEQSPTARKSPFPTGVVAHSVPPMLGSSTLVYQGNHIIVGWLTKLNDDTVPPGFFQRALTTPRAWLQVATYVDVKLITSAKYRAGGKKKSMLMWRRLTEVDSEMGNPDLDAKMQGVDRLRKSYVGAGNRAADWSHFFAVLAPTQEEAEEAYANACKGLRRYFVPERFWLSKDAQEAYWTMHGIIRES